MDEDPPTAHSTPAGAWSPPRQPRSRVEGALLLVARAATLAILWTAERLDRALIRARWHVGLSLARIAERIDAAGGWLLPEEPPAGTMDADTAAILREIAAADTARPTRPLGSLDDLWAPRQVGNGHSQRRRRRK